MKYQELKHQIWWDETPNGILIKPEDFKFIKEYAAKWGVKIKKDEYDSTSGKADELIISHDGGEEHHLDIWIFPCVNNLFWVKFGEYTTAKIQSPPLDSNEVGLTSAWNFYYIKCVGLDGLLITTIRVSGVMAASS